VVFRVELPPLPEVDDERVPVDFLVVAMRIFPPIFGMFLHVQGLAKCVPTSCVSS